MVEYEALAGENLEEQADQEDEIGRIAGVDHVEAVAAPDPQREQKFPEQCDGIFDEIGGGSSCFDRQGVAVDRYAVNDLMRLRIIWALGANHRYRMAGIAQSRRFRPDPAVERNRQVFDNNQHSELSPHRSTSQESRRFARNGRGRPIIFWPVPNTGPAWSATETPLVGRLTVKNHKS